MTGYLAVIPFISVETLALGKAVSLLCYIEMHLSSRVSPSMKWAGSAQ